MSVARTPVVPKHTLSIALVLVALTAAPEPVLARKGRQPKQLRLQPHHRTRLGALAYNMGRPFRAVGRGTRRMYKGASNSLAVAKGRACKIQNRTLCEVSTSSLLVSSAAGGVMRITQAAGPLGGPLTGIGSVGLGYVSIKRFRKAETVEKRVEAAHGMAWSLQGMTGLGYALQSKAAWLKPASQAVGVAGGALQAGIGAFRIYDGVKHKDRQRIVLGALDIGGGACWIASACAIATPWTLGGFIALTATRIGYERRDQIKEAARKLFRRKPRAPKPVKLRVPVQLGLEFSPALAAR